MKKKLRLLRKKRRHLRCRWGWGCMEGIIQDGARTGKRDFSFTAISAMAILLLNGAGFNLSSEPAPASGETIHLANTHLKLGFDARDGHLREFTERSSGHNHIGDKPGLLWQIEMSGLGSLTLTPENAGLFHVERNSREPEKLRLIWSRFAIERAPALSVEVTVDLDADAPMSRWGLAIRGLNLLAPEKIHFPRLACLTSQEDERLAVPVWQGQLAKNPRTLLQSSNGPPRRLDWSYPGLLSLQCLALYREGGSGLYLACDDIHANRKIFAVFGGLDRGLGCEIVHVPEQNANAMDRFAVPYHVLVGGFTGDWFTAAERYREWAINQPSARDSRLRRAAVPEWVANTGLWVWNRGRSTNVLMPAIALQEKSGLPVNVLWHWWHGCSYDTGFPEYLPPREGEKAFQSALAAAHRHNVHALVYMNQRLWGTTTASWTNENAERFAVKGADGKIHPEIYNTFTKAPCVSMCMGTEFWRKKYAGLAEKAVRQLGVDGIYMDQACSSLACYDAAHGHPPGGGNYWMNGFRALTSDIRGRLRENPQKFSARFQAQSRTALAGEGCGEAWLPYLDLMLSLQVSHERYNAPDGWETIPFFNAVYHDCAVTFGNYSSLTMPPYDDLWPAGFAPKEPLKLLDRKFSRQFYLEQARAFVWGQQPTIANFLPQHLEQRAEELEYALRLAKIRSRATKYLLRGTFLRPPRLDVPEAAIDISRLSIYAGQQGGLTMFQKRVPLALASAWRARDGKVAVVLASVADEPLELSLNLKAEEYGLPKRGRIYRIDENTRKLLGNFGASGVSLPLTLPPRGACILECARY